MPTSAADKIVCAAWKRWTEGKYANVPALIDDILRQIRQLPPDPMLVGHVDEKGQLLVTAEQGSLIKSTFRDLPPPPVGNKLLNLYLIEQPKYTDPTRHVRTSPGPVNCMFRQVSQGEQVSGHRQRGAHICDRCGKDTTHECPFFFADGMARDVPLPVKPD